MKRLILNSFNVIFFFLHYFHLKGVSFSWTWRTKTVEVLDFKGIQRLLGLTNGLRMSTAAAAFPPDERLYNSSEGPIFIIEEHTL